MGLRVLTPSTTLEPRLGRRLRGGMQIFVKTKGLRGLDRNQKTKQQRGSLPRMPTGPRQGSCRRYPRGPGKTLARNISKTVAMLCRPVADPAQRPTHQLKHVPTWQYVAPKPTSQAPTWWHANLREDPATTPAQQPASLHGAACFVGLDGCRSRAERRQMGRALLPSPIKQVDT